MLGWKRNGGLGAGLGVPVSLRQSGEISRAPQTCG